MPRPLAPLLLGAGSRAAAGGVAIPPSRFYIDLGFVDER